MGDGYLHWLMSDEFGLEDTSPDVPAWYAEAACAGHDPAAWFPEKGRHGKDAVAVCDDCPVRQECLQHALDHGEGSGIWGGLTARQRKRHARQAA